MKAIIEIGMDNAAFEENPSAELGRILRDLAERVEGVDISANLGDGTPIRDANGNKVGSVVFMASFEAVRENKPAKWCGDSMD